MTAEITPERGYTIGTLVAFSGEVMESSACGKTACARMSCFYTNCFVPPPIVRAYFY